jgi:hypothetical protein
MNVAMRLMMALLLTGQGVPAKPGGEPGKEAPNQAVRENPGGGADRALPPDKPVVVRWVGDDPVWSFTLPSWEKKNSAVQPEGDPGDLTWQEISLSLGILVYSLILFVIFAWMRVKGANWDLQTFKITSTLLLVTAGLFVMPAAYTDKQAAPLFGLLGTLAGYILSKTEGRSKQGDGSPAKVGESSAPIRRPAPPSPNGHTSARPRAADGRYVRHGGGDAGRGHVEGEAGARARPGRPKPAKVRPQLRVPPRRPR